MREHDFFLAGSCLEGESEGWRERKMNAPGFDATADDDDAVAIDVDVSGTCFVRFSWFFRRSGSATGERRGSGVH